MKWSTSFFLALFIWGVGDAGSAVYAQAPDWMFALEGTYVGRYEAPAENGDAVILDARWDGKRSAQEDGFVLQISRESGEKINKEAQMWSWNHEAACVEIMAIHDGQKQSSQWFEQQKGLSVELTRGSSRNHVAVIERIRIERLPGQLRVTNQFNTGDGTWQLGWKYILDDYISED